MVPPVVGLQVLRIGTGLRHMFVLLRNRGIVGLLPLSALRRFHVGFYWLWLAMCFRHSIPRPSKEIPCQGFIKNPIFAIKKSRRSLRIAAPGRAGWFFRAHSLGSRP